MPKYRVYYHYLATGMEGHADERDLGTFEADTKEEAMDMAVMQECPNDTKYGPNNSYSTRDFVRGCLSATKEFRHL